MRTKIAADLAYLRLMRDTQMRAARRDKAQGFRYYGYIGPARSFNRMILEFKKQLRRYA